MKTWLGRSALVATMLVGALTAGAAARGLGDAVEAESSKASGRTAKAQLDDAKQLRRNATKKTGEEKRAALSEAVAAYRKVLEEHAGEDAACAEAAFRMGEVQRTLGEQEGAKQAFEAAVKHGKAAPQFGSRALSELGHLARRKQQWEEAIALYRRVAAEFPGQEAEAARARTWVGKVEAKLGKHEDARRTWLAIGDEFPKQPILAIRAADLAALSWLEQGDPEAARKVVSDAATRYGFDNKDQEWWSPEVDEALARMKAKEKLDGGSPKTARPDGDDEDDAEETGR